MYRQARRHDGHGRTPRPTSSRKTHGLETVVIPTNQPIIRDEDDHVYRTTAEKYAAVTGRPRLPRARPAGSGTPDRELELLSGLLTKAAPGAECQAACPRGRDRGPGRPPEDDHHRHQHGRARHRHRARRQRREAGGRSVEADASPRAGGRAGARARNSRDGVAAACTTWSQAAGGLRIVATERARVTPQSTTSCAAARAARATPVPRAST